MNALLIPIAIGFPEPALRLSHRVYKVPSRDTHKLYILWPGITSTIVLVNDRSSHYLSFSFSQSDSSIRATMSSIPSFTLNNGVKIPAIGAGFFNFML